ncbi:hypothetical protein BU26DRAFT_499168 [Trematosphaeria pertusa]|uniref:Uncharacterized protein n=1 Tax=Trematosphaeria pertusa TaxID=390896 RepID=A0A6A6J165_9PLEO|nr:uncharacterized protein BU26DRAFT_499168 [Trematosphaeria pertusa]KAF2256514.1 hypothetical protein BU26DRAFT_499168 [Trematosphaeria pertusa]
MRPSGEAFAFLSFLCTVSAFTELSLDCAGRKGQEDAACQQPPEPIATVVPGSFYVARLPCGPNFCTTKTLTGEGPNQTVTYAAQDFDLFFNISLSSDNRTLFLNDVPIYPSIRMSPRPPDLVAGQVPRNFTRADLDDTIACTREHCQTGSLPCRCLSPQISSVALDFDYYSHWLESHPETQTQKWEITFDAIGGEDLAFFRDERQYMLRIILDGKEIKAENFAGEKDRQAASSLFDVPKEEGKVYAYGIASVEFAERTHIFTIPGRPLGPWTKFRHFFGLDVVEEDGHVIFIHEEWGWYGKKGSLPNALGKIINDWPWALIFIIFGSIIGGILALIAAWKLFFLVKRQRELARWDGMDVVWERMRRQPSDEEEEGLLRAGYRDEPDETRPPPYTDEVDTNKPLPSKPLPEKPLPAPPLIDT